MRVGNHRPPATRHSQDSAEESHLPGSYLWLPFSTNHYFCLSIIPSMGWRVQANGLPGTGIQDKYTSAGVFPKKPSTCGDLCVADFAWSRSPDWMLPAGRLEGGAPQHPDTEAALIILRVVWMQWLSIINRLEFAGQTRPPGWSDHCRLGWFLTGLETVL